MASIDDRVVSMKFDNAAFQSKIGETLQSLEKLQRSLDLSNAAKGLTRIDASQANASLQGMASSVDNISSRFNALGVAAASVIFNITNKVTDAALNFGKQFTVAPIMDGFREMETKFGSIQTILANTARHGTKIGEVTSNLERLNEYSDKTIYNFGQMTKNIGLFTNAGIKIQDATEMIEGFSNAAAASGTNAEGAAGAAYQLSQALSAGKVTLMDWRSLQNVGMGNQNMKDGILDIAKAMGTLEEAGTDAEEVQANFNGSLESGWLTADVMSTYLKAMRKDFDHASLASIGMSASSIAALKAQAEMGDEAATKVRTWTQLVGTLKESVASGWAKTFEIFLGGFEGATEIFTGINNVVGGFIGNLSKGRNDLLEMWVALEGRLWLVDGLKILFKTLGDVVQTLGEAWRKVFPPTEAKTLVYFSWLFQHLVRMFTEAVEKVLPALSNIFGAIFTTLKLGFVIIKSVVGLLGDFWSALYPSGGGGDVIGFVGNLAGALMRLNLFLIDNGIPGFFALLGKTITPVIRIIGNFIQVIKDFFVNIEYSRGLRPVLDFLRDMAERIGSVVDLLKMNRSFITAFAQAFGSFAAGSVIVTGLAAIRDALNTAMHAANQFFQMLFFYDVVKGPFQEDGKFSAAVLKINRLFVDLFNTIKSLDFSGLLDSIGRTFNKFKEGLGNLFSFGDDDSEEKFEKVNDSVKKFSDNYDRVYQTVTAKSLSPGAIGFGNIDLDLEGKAEGIKNFVEMVGIYLDALKDVLSGYVKNLVDIGGSLRGAIFKFFTGSEIVSSTSGFEAFVKIIQSVLITGILLLVADFIKQMGGLVREVKAVFGELGGTLREFGKESKSTALLKIAVALALLASALKKIADIPFADLKNALGALGITLGVMIGAVTILDKVAKNDGVAKAATAMIFMAGALRVMASAIEILGRMDLEELKQGLIAATAGITVLSLATRLVGGQGPGMIAAATAVLALSGALIIMAGAIKLFAAFDPKELAIGLAAASVALLALGFAVGQMGPAAILAGPGVLILAGALIVIAEAVRQFANIDDRDLAKGLGAIALSLLAIALSIGKLPPSFLLVAAGMPMVAGALLLIADALAKIGAIDDKSLAKSLGSIYLMLGMIVNAVRLMTKALPGAAAMVVVAGALLVLSEVLIKLGSQDWQTLALGLGIMAATFIVLALAGKFLAPVLTALGAAMLLLGAGFLMFGLGVAAAVGAFVYLVNASNENAREFIGVLEYMAKEIPRVIALFIKHLAEASDEIAVSFDLMMKSVETMIIRALDAVITVIPKMAEVVDKIISAIIDFIGNRLVDFIELGFKIILALAQGLLENVGELTTTAVKILAAFAKTIANELPSIIDSGIRILRALVRGLGERMHEIIGMGVQVILSFLDGVASQALALANGAAQVLIDFLNGLAEAIRTNAPAIRRAGANVALAIVEGITFGLVDANAIKKVIDSVKDLAGRVIEGFAAAIGADSPAKEFIRMAGYMAQGVAVGLNKDTLAENSAVRSAERIVAAFAETLAHMPEALDGMDEFNPVITPVLDLTRVAAGARGLDALMSVATITPNVSTDQARIIATTAQQEQTPEVVEPQPTNITFIQNNTSPQALSTNDIYRQTKSQFASAKEKLNIK